ncbi:MAG: TIGR03943 family protein [Desulfocapsaceae bacterium]|nr:TIGR03943 family protein [Desulfocapsaceae bacterium]
MLFRLLNILLLLIWAVFLVWLLTYGKSDLIRLIHPRLWWVLGIAVIVLVFFLLSLIISNRQTESKKNMLLKLPGILILLIPVMYFFIAKDARLDGASLQNRFILDHDGFYLNNLPPFDLFDDSKSSEMVFSKILRDPNKYEDQDVEIVCQSFVHEELPENTAMCYRYLITCCAADALPAFIFLSHQDEQEIENNRWVKLNGPLSIIKNNDMEFPSVKIESIEYVEEPAFPWAM